MAVLRAIDYCHDDCAGVVLCHLCDRLGYKLTAVAVEEPDRWDCASERLLDMPYRKVLDGDELEAKVRVVQQRDTAHAAALDDVRHTQGAGEQDDEHALSERHVAPQAVAARGVARPLDVAAQVDVALPGTVTGR
eukprot:3757989-Prymnesium_polylepis.2